MEQERESIEALNYQLRQWRRLVKYLPPTDCDRDDVSEIEKLIKEPPNTQMQINAPIVRCSECDCILTDPLCYDCFESSSAHD